jgi:WD40 repeat protein
VRHGDREFNLVNNVAGESAIAFSAGGQYLVVSNATSDIDVWKLATAALARPPIRAQQAGSVMVSSPDAQTLVFGGSGGSLAALDAGQRTFYQPHGNPLLVVAVSPDGRTAAIGSSDGTVQLWPIGRPGVAHLLPGRQGAVHGIAFSPGGTTVATISSRCVARVWDAVTGRQLARLPTPRRLTVGGRSNESSLAFSPDGKTLATFCSSQPTGAISHDTAIVWNTATFRPAALYTMRGGRLRDGLAYAPGGRTLALDNGSGGVLLWNPSNHRVTRLIRTGQASSLVIKFSRDGKWLATAGADSTVRLWNASNGALVKTISVTSQVHDLEFSPHGSLLAVVGQDANVSLLTVPGLRPWAELAQPAPSAPATGLSLIVNRVAFGGDGHTLVAVNSDGVAQVWDLRPVDEVRDLCNALRGPGLARQWRQQTSAPNPCRAG